MRVWNAMNGSIDWAAVPMLAAFEDIDDLQLLADHLIAIREARKPQQTDPHD